MLGLVLHLYSLSLSRLPIEKFSSDYIDVEGRHFVELENDQCNLRSLKSLPPSCRVGDADAKPIVALIGDSHAWTLKSALKRKIPEKWNRKRILKENLLRTKGSYFIKWKRPLLPRSRQAGRLAFLR